MCDLYEPTQEQRLDEALKITEMGDRRPSRFARELERLFSGISIEDVMARVFHRSLPQDVKTAISGTAKTLPFREMVAAADAAWSRNNDDRSVGVNATSFRNRG